jgi:hypothetical protein
VAIPFILAALIPPLMQGSDPDGPPMPDPEARPSRSLISAGHDRTSEGLTATEHTYEVNFDSDGLELLVRAQEATLLPGALDDFTAEERRRGKLFSPSEMPVWVGTVNLNTNRKTGCQPQRLT